MNTLFLYPLLAIPLAPILIATWFTISREVIESFAAFDKTGRKYNPEGRICGEITMYSRTSKVTINIRRGTPKAITERLFSILERCFEKDVPWRKVKLALENNIQQSYPSPKVGGKTIVLSTDKNGNAVITFPKYPAWKERLKYKALKSEVDELFENMDGTDNQTSIELNVVSDFESQLQHLKELVLLSSDTSYQDNTNVRQVFNIHLIRLNNMLESYERLIVGEAKEKAKVDITDTITLLTETLTDHLENANGAEGYSISSSASNIRAMIHKNRSGEEGGAY